MKINSINNSQYNVKSNNNINNTKAVSFNGGFEPKCIVEPLSKFYSSLSNNSLFQKGIHSFSKSDKSFTHILAAESFILSSFYMLCTLRNDKIDKEQKPQMVINDTLTLGFATAGAYLTDGTVKKAYDGFVENHYRKNKDFYVDLGKKTQEASKTISPFEAFIDKTKEIFKNKSGFDEAGETLNKDLKNIIGKGDKLKAFQITKDKFNEAKDGVKNLLQTSKTIEEAMDGVKKLTSELYDLSLARKEADLVKAPFSKLRGIVVFGFIYRFVSPVVFTPIANKLSSKFFPQKGEK